MDTVLQRCGSCGYQRHKAPSAYPHCCGRPMEAVIAVDIWLDRVAHPLVAESAASVTAEVVCLAARRRVA